MPNISDDDESYIVQWAGFSFGLLSLILSILTLYVIYRMCDRSTSTAQLVSEPEANPIQTSSRAHNSNNVTAESVNKTATERNIQIKTKPGTKFNGYLLLIVTMTCFQIFYDVGYMLYISKNYSVCLLANFLSVFCGLCVTIWTNIISFIIYYVVTYVSSLVSIVDDLSFTLL